MNWDIIGATGEWAGALAVVATLFYLARQIRQSNELSRFGAARDLFIQLNELNRMVATDAALRQLLSQPGELSADEREQLYNFAMMFCNVWIAVQIAYDNGQVDKALYESGLTDVQVELRRWPNFKAAAAQWLDNYPEHRQLPILEPLVSELSDS
jgi:hypothetical protein